MMTKKEKIDVLLKDFKENDPTANRATQSLLAQMLNGLDDKSLSTLVAQATNQKLELMAAKQRLDEPKDETERCIRAAMERS